MAKTSGSRSQAEKKILKAFGERLRKVREKKGLSVYDLTGDDMPIKSRQHWQQIENGQKNINLTTLYKISSSLDVEPDELIETI